MTAETSPSGSPDLISYAQNLEDVMLWRALGRQITSGFYIDVGAAWPTRDSVTRLFYDAGWRGINIEPNPDLFRELVGQRLRDVNLPLALSDAASRERINIVRNTGLSTLDEDLGRRHFEDGFEIDSIEVDVMTLADLWRDHVPPDQPVHFLKVDVEGFEAAVLRGANWSLNRPWILVIESTVPRSQAPSHLEWEPVLVAANYELVYQDGVNRFYLAAEHRDLAHHFAYPPNVFDGFTPSALVDAELRVVVADERAAEYRGCLARKEFEFSELSDRAAWLERQLRAVETAHAGATKEVHRLNAAIDARDGQISERDKHLSQMMAEAQATRLNLQSARREIADLELALSAAWSRIHELDSHVAAMLHSASWRFSAPIRVLGGIGRRVALAPGRAGRLPRRALGRVVVRPLRRTIRFVLNNPWLERRARVGIVRWPALHRRLYRLGAPTRRGPSEDLTVAIDPMAPPTFPAPAPSVGLQAETLSSRTAHGLLRAALRDQTKAAGQ